MSITSYTKTAIDASRLSQRALTKRGAFPTLMTSPPTIGAVKTSFPGSDVPNAQFIGAAEPMFPGAGGTLGARFSYLGGAAQIYSTFYAQAVEPTPGYPLSLYVEGWHYGTQIEFASRCDPGNSANAAVASQVWVNDQPAEAVCTADTGNDDVPHRRLVTFATAGLRKVGFWTTAPFFGINIGPTDTWVPTPNSANRLLVIGDSYGAGVGADGHFSGYAQQLGRALGFDETWLSCVGGTGLLNAGPSTTYRGRSADWSGIGASAAMVQMSINDDSSSVAALAAELHLVIAALRALPTIKTIWVQGWCALDGDDVANRVTRDAAMAAAIADTGVPYVSLVSSPLGPIWTGSGGADSPSGTGSSDVLFHNAGLVANHPTQVGHDVIARAAFAGIRRLQPAS